MAVPIIHKRLIDALIRQQGNSEFTRQMLSYNTVDLVVQEDDFLGRTFANSGAWYSMSGNAGSKPDVPGTLVVNGAIDLVTGDTSEGYSALAGALQWRSDLSAVMVAIIRVDDIAAVKMEVGFTDANGADDDEATDEGAVTLLQATPPTAKATDAALWVFDTDDTGNTAWQTFGVDSDTVATKVEPTSIGNVDGDAAPNVDEYDVLVVALSETSARFLRGDMVDVDGNDLERRLTLTYDSGWQADYISPNTLLCPWVFVQTRETSTKTALLDYIGVWQNRYAEER